MNPKYKRHILIALVLLFCSLFLRNITSDLPLIFEKTLRAHDESSNSVVAANVTRKFFPPMLRINPLDDQQGVWMEGPHWQHIPPLFAYVPYVFFALDAEISIEGKRLSFAFLTLLTGLLFIAVVYLFSKSLLATFAAFTAAVFWVYIPFTRELISGYAFGVSDIVLAFSTICAFGGLLWYLNHEKSDRFNYPWWKFAAIAFLVALPILAKNLLGAIPAAIFLLLLIRDFRSLSRQIWIATGGFIAPVLVYYLPLYFASPETFKNEILVAFVHLGDLEGWGRPWHYYLTEYLPHRYLLTWSWAYYLGLAFGSLYLALAHPPRREKILLALSSGWFVWNVIAISLVESKVPNFIYQSILLSVFFIIYSLFLALKSYEPKLNTTLLSRLIVFGLLAAVLFFAVSSLGFTQQFFEHRNQAYAYESEMEKFYQTAGELRQLGFDANDLAVIFVSDNDCWFRYYILFLTGAESKTLLEMSFNPDLYEKIAEKYSKVHLIINRSESLTQIVEFERRELVNYSLISIDSGSAQLLITSLISKYQDEIQTNVERIKDDKTSCQWLVPDHILNSS